MKIILVLVVGLLFGGAAKACECPFAPITPIEARAASNVFVFRLTDARVEQLASQERSDSVVGAIEIVSVVRGSTNAQTIRYTTTPCCGSVFQVGKYYIAFLSSDSRQFDGNSSNILGLWDGFGQHEIDRLEEMLSSKNENEDRFASAFEDVSQLVVPPPPCSYHGMPSRKWSN